MSQATFTSDAFLDLIREFADRIPALLARDSATAELAVKIEQMDLLNKVNARLSVAVVGQMRSAKSTLVNALIGKPITLVGVTETTATINWISFGPAEKQEVFQVTWLDESKEELPLARLEEWVGDSERAKETKRLDFFADTGFLRVANIIDTPGSRTVIDWHDNVRKKILQLANAFVYVLPSKPRSDDQEVLREIEEMRMPGSYPTNSIAVIQKWEELTADDPLEKAWEVTEGMRKPLEGLVSVILPVSGLLAVVVQHAPSWTWDACARLAVNSSQSALDKMLSNPSLFLKSFDGEGMPPNERERLQDTLKQVIHPGKGYWNALRYVIRLAKRASISDGPALKKAVWEASGLDRLQHTLQQRFFEYTILVKTCTLLKQVLDPCVQASLLLRERGQAREKDLLYGRHALTTMTSLLPSQPMLHEGVAYIRSSLSAVEADANRIRDMRLELDSFVYKVREAYELLNSDLATLQFLYTNEVRERAFLNRLLGAEGGEPWQRLGLARKEDFNASIRNNLLDYHEQWATRAQRASGSQFPFYQHILARLDGLLDALEDPGRVS